jgi:hypothetical protein
MKRRRAPRLLIAAALLLACVVCWSLWSSRAARERRETTLAGVPAFPQPRQETVRRPLAKAAVLLPQPIAKPPPAPRQRQDNLLSFVQASSGTVTLIHVNALFNTPLAERLRQCLPKGFQDLQTAVPGLDVTRDIDRVAFASGGGMLVSGFFEGNAGIQKLMQTDAAPEQYRGATISTHNNQCRAQLGNLLVFAPAGTCQDHLDRALAPTPEAAPDEIYGDLYLRTDLAALREDKSNSSSFRPLVDALSGLTLRANVWDSVALSVEGNPMSGKDGQDLSQMASGAMQLFKTQLGDDQVELQALAELTKVKTADGKLQVDLALPVADLFDKLHIPCPGLQDAGTP